MNQLNNPTPQVMPPSPQPAKKPFSSTKAMIAIGALVLFLLLLFANQVVPRVLLYLTQATNSPGQYSLANSYVFGSPLVAAANGEDKIRVTAFLLDDKGRGVAGSQIDLRVAPASPPTGEASPQIEAVTPVTDEFGRAVFEIFSSSKGQFVVSAQVGGLDFPQTTTLTFR
ncbi:MAG: Ig-like domain-containing protein [Candidatus Shapirobacteria bacterium]